MMKFIKLKGPHPIYININKIEYVSSYPLSEGYETRIVTDGSYNNYTYHVTEETAEEIMEMINGD